MKIHGRSREDVKGSKGDVFLCSYSYQDVLERLASQWMNPMCCNVSDRRYSMGRTRCKIAKQERMDAGNFVKN